MREFENAKARAAYYQNHEKSKEKGRLAMKRHMDRKRAAQAAAAGNSGATAPGTPMPDLSGKWKWKTTTVDMDPTVAAFLGGLAPLPMGFKQLGKREVDPRYRGLDEDQMERLEEAAVRVSAIRNGRLTGAALRPGEAEQLAAYKAAQRAADVGHLPPPAEPHQRSAIQSQSIPVAPTPAPQEDDFK